MKRVKKHKGYSPSALTNAYKLVKETGIPIKTAARQYGVPHNTLRDRVKGRVNPETTMTGSGPLFTLEEEAKLVAHIKLMADLGYGFTITEVVSKASDYAVFLKKRTRDKPLTVKWFKGLRNRWPELRVIKPRGLAKCRAEATNEQAVESYFTNLENVLKSNVLEYLQSHFIKYIQRSDPNQQIIIIFDGHKSHINVPVLEWAKKNNIILFVLPAHTSHVLQPLDVACYGPLQKIYNYACQKFIREHPSSKITRYNIAELASNAYVTALSVNNLRAAFEKTGIFPFNRTVISADIFKPSIPYVVPQENTLASDTQPCIDNYFTTAENIIEMKKAHHTLKKTLRNHVSGQEITSDCINQEILSQPLPRSKDTPVFPINKRKQTKTNATNVNQSNVPLPEPLPGPSHIGICDTDSQSSEDDVSEEDKCCVCKLFQPKELKNCVSLVFTKWAQCDHQNCGHWTHLIYCCKQKVVRRNDVFECPCHKSEE